MLMQTVDIMLFVGRLLWKRDRRSVGHSSTELGVESATEFGPAGEIFRIHATKMCSIVLRVPNNHSFSRIQSAVADLCFHVFPQKQEPPSRGRMEDLGPVFA